MKKYIGITIGPIFDTINLTSSPVALWASSYLFSQLSKALCEQLLAAGLREEAIVTPYYSRGDELLLRKDGVGLYPDRIIFCSEGFEKSRFPGICDRAVNTVLNQFGLSASADYLKKYLRISAAEYEAENPIEGSTHILNSLELSGSFVDRETDGNPILTLFNGNDETKNAKLRETPVISSLENFQLRKSDGFKSIEDIVTFERTGFKKYNYYAIVRADGDNMSGIISSLSGDGAVRSFSKACLGYCSDIAEKVREFGGVTVYSGGDDLLAILPCESEGGRTPFDFVGEARGVFNKHFAEYSKPVSLSFGIFIAYRKFPLYEALDSSWKLLFYTAKDPQRKNGTAVTLQKHSGQSEKLFIGNELMGSFTDILKKFTARSKQAAADKKTDTESGGSDVLTTVMHKLAEFGPILDEAGDTDTVGNLFKNLFDGVAQKDSDFLQKDVCRFYDTVRTSGGRFISFDSNGGLRKHRAETVCDALRVAKFYSEKSGGKS